MPAGMMASAAQMFAGGLVLLAIGWLRGESLPSDAPLRAWLCLAYLCVFGSIIGFSAFSYLLQHVRPALATSYAYVNPVVAVAVGIGLGHEDVSLYAVAALSIILCSVALVAREQRKHA
jgi:drug/metabolite transporter (DMT)-like permease